MQSFTYLAIDFACIIIPFIASFYKPHAFYKTWVSFIKACLIVGIIFLVWDHFFTVAGVWGFNPKYLTGIYLGVLPIEEILFFVCIPYSCVFTFFALKYLISRNPLQKIQSKISYALIFILGSLAAFHINHIYTSLTFISLSLYLIHGLYIGRNMSYHYLSYLCILPFFFISNGLLTGSIVDAPIVWYNNDENLGFRLGTIPFEDIFYGFLLIIMNIDLYQHFQSKIHKYNLADV